MDCCGYSSPKSDAFPAGLRVLVVDDDPTWLKILEKMLKKCYYEVTTCGMAREALNLLRERKDGFDIVISDVNMPDMDGFKLLEHVGLEMDLPVIMMSVDGETSRVMKGVQHGACDYLLKPIRMKELRNIWQHVFRKRIHEVRDIESHEGIEDIQFMRNGSGNLDDRYFPCGTDLTSGKKRKDFEHKHGDRACNDSLSVKKTRVIWTVDLHQKFVKAVNQIGFEKVGPKKILDLMGVPWLTRENVASHLQGLPISMNCERSHKNFYVGQKYRLYLGRLQKEEVNASLSRMEPADLSTKEHTGNQCRQNPAMKQQCDSTSGNYNISRNSSTMQNIDFKILEGDRKCTVSKAIGEPNKPPNGDNLDPQKNSISRTNFKNPFGQFDLEVELPKTIGKHNSWNEENPLLCPEQESKQHFQPSGGFNLGTLPAFQQNIDLEHLQPVCCSKSKPSSSERNITAEDVKPASVSSRSKGIEQLSPGRSKGIGQLSPGRSRADVFSILPDKEITTEHSIKPNPNTLWSIKNHSLDQIPVTDLKCAQQRVNLASMTTFASWDENPRPCSIDGDLQPLNLGLENVESLSSSDSELLAEAPACLYDSLELDYEYPLDSMELSAVGNGLFII